MCSRLQTYDGIVDTSWAKLGAELLDILHPSMVLVDVVGRKTNDLYAASSKVPGSASDFTKLGGANGGKVIYEQVSVSLRIRTGNEILPG